MTQSPSMRQNELSCLVILLFVSPLLYWSLRSRPKPVASAILSIPHREQRLPQELSLLSAWNRCVHHVVVLHGNLTSVRDVVLVSFLLTPCSSNSL